MEKQQFLDTLAVLPYEWYLDENNLRARDEGGNEHCPITAVCYFLTAKRFGDCRFGKAGKIIGLPPKLTAGIANSADKCWFHDKTLRQELLDRTINRESFINKTLREVEAATATTLPKTAELTMV